MVMTKSLPSHARGQAKYKAATGRRLLSAKDKKALPFLTQKCTDPNNPEFGMWQEDRILKHIHDRLRLSDYERQLRIERMREIDIQLSGLVVHDEEDRKRDKSNKMGRKAKPVSHNLPLAYAQIDDLVTYCMSLFAPETNMFVATSQAKKQSVAEGLTREIGKQGQTLQYYRQTAAMVLKSAKYNFGAMTVKWEQSKGTVFAPADAGIGASSSEAQNNGNNLAGQLKKTKGTVWEGNVLKSVDTYNFFYDTSVHPVDLPRMGEYFAEVELKTPFQVKRMAAQDILFGIDRFIDLVAPISNSNQGVSYYVQPPTVREYSATPNSGGNGTNWVSVLSPGSVSGRGSQPSLELAWFTMWVIPSDFGFSADNELALWEVCMVNGQFIAAAFPIDDSHGMLPCGVATPIEDDLNNDQRTYAEMLLPLQHFASFLLNTHVDATRKAIYGITVYDSSLFPGLDLETEDLIGARIPMKSSATGIDIDKAFRHYNDAPQTDQNVDMVGKIAELMQKILPTNMAQQVADLERATEYQAAATVQAGSRRNLKIARLINDQCLSIVKFQMMYNIYAHVKLIEYTDASGATQTITPSDLFNAQIEFDIGTGLKGLDRLMQVAIFKDLMGYLFQVKDIGAQVDLLGLLSYVTQLAGFETDLSTFRTAPPGTLPGQPGVGHNGGPPLDANAPADTSNVVPLQQQQ